MYKVESDATISSPVNRSNMELLYFLKELEKDVKARNSSTPQDPSALEQLTFEYENIVNALHKAEYVCDLTPSACYYKTLGSLMCMFALSQFFVATIVAIPAAIAATSTIAAIPAHAPTRAWEALLALITFAIVLDLIVIVACFVYADTILETIRVTNKVLDDKRRASDMIWCATRTLKPGSCHPVSIQDDIKNLIEGCKSIYDNLRRAKFIAVHRLARNYWILGFAATGILLFFATLFFLLILTLPATIKAEHESGSSTGTHEYTRGNTRG